MTEVFVKIVIGSMSDLMQGTANHERVDNGPPPAHAHVVRGNHTSVYFSVCLRYRMLYKMYEFDNLTCLRSCAIFTLHKYTNPFTFFHLKLVISRHYWKNMLDSQRIFDIYDI